MLSKLWRLFHRAQQPFDPQSLVADEDLTFFHPPTNPLDVEAWDQYWFNQVSHGFGPPICDMFCDDSRLVRVMSEEGMKRILCAGNGVSQEPKALAAAGMDVMALDLSPWATDVARRIQLPAEALTNYCEPGLQRAGGHADFVAGNILDAEVCPGPFDVIIERLTAQNYFSSDIRPIMEALAGRLTENGIFFSHSHDGRWRPPAKRRHYTEPWFREAGWTIWNGEPGRKPAGRVAWLLTSTG